MTASSAESGAADWFADQVISGVQALIALHLPGGPPADTIGYTGQVWINTLWSASSDWQMERDAQRINEAFTQLSRRCDRWPAPVKLLESLPARAQPVSLPPPISESRRRENSARLREIVNSLLKRG